MKEIKAPRSIPTNKIQEQNDALKAAYAAADIDPDREEALKDWDSLDLEGWED